MVADLDGDVGERMVKELETGGREGLSFPMDVRDVEAAGRLTEVAVDRFGGIDILVNNAGIHLDPRSCRLPSKRSRNGVTCST